MAKVHGFQIVCKCSLTNFSRSKIPYESPGIYAIQNIKDGKIYIGQTESLYRRLRHHIRQLKTDVHDNIYLQRAFNLHGGDAFEIVVVEFCALNLLTDRERMYLAMIPKSLRYNLIECNLSLSGWNHAEETKRRISENSANREPVIQKNKIGEPIKIYRSFLEAANENGFCVVGIRSAAIGKVDIAYGFRWEFVNEEKKLAADELRAKRKVKKAESDARRIERVRAIGKATKGRKLEEIMGEEVARKMKKRMPELTAKAAEANRKKIAQYDLSGNLINTYDSLTEASYSIAGKYCGRISWACKKEGRTSHGFKWQLFNNEI